MDLTEKIHRCLLAVRTGLRRIHAAIQEQPDTKHVGEERNRNKQFPSDKVRAIVSFDDETIRNANAESKKQHTTQEGIRKATVAAVVAAGIYALISLAIWCQMIKQNRTANSQLHQSTESFRIDERAWIEIESVKLKSVIPATPKIAKSFLYEIYFKNVGKTVARDVSLKRVFSLDGNQGEVSSRGIEMAQDKLLTDQPGEPSPVPSLPLPKSLAPNTPTFIPIKLGGAAPQYGYLFSYNIGRVDYTDVFGVKHWMKFCFVITDSDGNLGYCQAGNDEDKNPELSPN